MIRRPARPESDEDYTEDQDDAPKRRQSSPVDDYEAEDDEESSTKPATRVIKRGWAAAAQVKAAGSAYAQSLKVGEDPVLIKFLEDEPYASYRSHWVDRSGQKSFVCIADIDPKGCPLCDAHNRPSHKFSFNVVLLNPEDEPVVKSYDVGTRVIDQLKNFHMDQRQGPLTKHYWAVSKTGKGTSTSTNHQMVRERDLGDFDVEALSAVDIKSLAKSSYDEEIIRIPNRKELLEIAEELS